MLIGANKNYLRLRRSSPQREWGVDCFEGGGFAIVTQRFSRAVQKILKIENEIQNTSRKAF